MKLQEKMKIKILPGGTLPNFKNGDWIDCYTRFDCKLKYMEIGVLRLGFSAELPKGYEALLIARSSLSKNFKVMSLNGVGLIDENYCGDADEWLLPVICIDESGTEILSGSRVAQFRIITHQPKFSFKVVEKLDNENRGGYGSTGKI